MRPPFLWKNNSGFRNIFQARYGRIQNVVKRLFQIDFPEESVVAGDVSFDTFKLIVKFYETFQFIFDIVVYGVHIEIDNFENKPSGIEKLWSESGRRLMPFHKASFEVCSVFVC
jgi:hypothetical protein